MLLAKCLSREEPGNPSLPQAIDRPATEQKKWVLPIELAEKQIASENSIWQRLSNSEERRRRADDFSKISAFIAGTQKPRFAPLIIEPDDPIGQQVEVSWIALEGQEPQISVVRAQAEILESCRTNSLPIERYQEVASLLRPVFECVVVGEEIDAASAGSTTGKAWVLVFEHRAAAVCD